jgi:hypothetical protein
MELKHNLACYHLKGSEEGAKCGVVDVAVRLIEDINIKLCLSRHHEACRFYRMSLREECPLPSLQNVETGISEHAPE